MNMARCTLVLMAATLVACRDSTAPRDHAPLTIVAGASVTDTIGTQLIQALMVEVTDRSGHPIPNVVVRFTSLPASTGDAPTAYIAPLTQTSYGSFVADSTDSAGRSAVLVELGRVAGPAGVQIIVPVLGLSDTARYTVQPGAAAHIKISVRDTSVARGTQYSLAATPTDRFGNLRPSDSISFTSESPVVTVDARGNVTAAQEGRGTILVHSGTANDSATVSVFPLGTLVLWGGGQLAVANTDGSDRKLLTTSNNAVLDPQWSPDGSKVLIYEDNPESGARISTVDMNGARTPIVGPNASIRAASYGRYTRDGSWIYFTGVGTSNYTYVTWRVHPDGTQLEQVGPTAAQGGSLRPDVSPDGSTVVYQVPGGDLGLIAAMNVSTQTITSLGVTGTFPTFSPDGSQIAFFGANPGGAKGVFVMNADGTSVRQLSPINQAYHAFGLSWSPDGKWIVAAATTNNVDLLRVSDGLRLPLRLSGFEVDWKP